MRVKVIINDGVTVGVLADGDVEVEIIDDDRDYEDHEYLEKYEAEVRGEDGEPDPWPHKD